MAMFNGFPQYYPQSYPQVPPPANGINWVQGIEGAKAFQLSPNSHTILMDSENDGIFYIKVSDNVGMCNLRTFKYEEITNTPSPAHDEYVKKSELEALVTSIVGGVKDEPVVQSTKSSKTITK